MIYSFFKHAIETGFAFPYTSLVLKPIFEAALPAIHTLHMGAWSKQQYWPARHFHVDYSKLFGESKLLFAYHGGS